MTMAAEQANLRTIQAFYEAFGQGDIAGLLAPFAVDVEWEYAFDQSMPVPWLRPGRGIDHVAKFFGTLAEHLEVHSFSVNNVLAAGDVVVVLFSIECTVRPTGKRIIERDEPHIFHFDANGKVVRFRHAADTLQQSRAVL